MPRVRVITSPPLEYLTAGEEYEVSIGDRDVGYQRVGPDGSTRGQPGTFGRRWHYADYIRRGDLVLLKPAMPVPREIPRRKATDGVQA
jgi:hypothetical protein